MPTYPLLSWRATLIIATQKFKYKGDKKMQCGLPMTVLFRGSEPRKTPQSVRSSQGNTRTSSISIKAVEQTADSTASNRPSWMNADTLVTRAAAANGYAFPFRCQIKVDDMKKFSPMGMSGVFVQGGLVRSQMKQIRSDIKTLLEAQKEARAEPDNPDRQTAFKQKNKAFKKLYGNLFPECNFAKAGIASWFQELSEYLSRLDRQKAQTAYASPALEWHACARTEYAQA